jgi:uncharacterized membrane-anchored protein
MPATTAAVGTAAATTAAASTAAATTAAATTAATYAAYASLAIGAMSAIASGVSQYQNNKAQQAYNDAQVRAQKQAWEQNSKATAQEFANQTAAERVAQMQEREKTAMEVQEAQREALRKAGTMMASTNAAGGTLNFLMQDYARQEAQAKETHRAEYAMQAVSSDFAVQSYRNKAQNRLDSMSGYTYIDSGSQGGMIALTTALGIGKAGLSAYGTYNKYSKETPGTEGKK